ncbi:MAG: DNA polymerase/3'-5' exonuclease PolX [Chloroflexi bacterium]|nr:DNA polymerase/3'-5' exonuclease PolX [Chloroflexota bacterium]
MRNKEIARWLDNIGDLLEIKGESSFRVGAYREAARRIESHDQAIEKVCEEGKLRGIPAVGESIAARIQEYLATGRSQYYEDLLAAVPPGLVELLQIPGLGPKKAQLVYRQLGVTGIDELEVAAREHRLRTLPGMGEKSEEKIIRELERWRNRSRRHLLGFALPLAEQVALELSSCPAVLRIDPGGSIRRRKETIGDIDILAAAERADDVMDCFTSLSTTAEVIARGPTKSSVLTHDSVQIDLRVVKPESYGAALQYFTGSKAHNVRLREMAQRRGLKINEYGIFEEGTGGRLGGGSEEEVYALLSLPLIPPELREDQGEFEAAVELSLPNLIEMGDIKGDLHVHTNWSDGVNTLEEVALAARARGYDYVAICDHSRALGVAHGLSVERVLEQQQLIRQLNEKLYPFRVLAGIEMDIRADGTLDYEDDLLRQFDIVTVSIHSAMGQAREKITERIVTALRNPYVKVFNHPTGRIISRREAYEVDIDVVIATAAETHTALEINAAPDRLDLNDAQARRAKALGVPLAINTDAHQVGQFDYMRYGIAMARRGWLEKRDVLNALPLPDLLAWLSQSR